MSRYVVVGEINPAAAWNFHRWADSVPQAERHEVAISSNGGDIGLMVGMYDVIQELKADTLALGIVQSAAAVLFQAGRTRTMSMNSLLLFHEPPKLPSGEFEDKDWYLLSKMVEMVSRRSETMFVEVHNWFDDKFINGDRAIQLNLCDEVQCGNGLVYSKYKGGSDGTSSGIPSSEGSDLGQDAGGDAEADSGPVVGG